MNWTTVVWILGAWGAIAAFIAWGWSRWMQFQREADERDAQERKRWRDWSG